MTALPPAEKLPLVVRKDLRDSFESKKPELEEKLSKTLDAEWKIDINPLALYPYAVANNSWGKDSLGSCITSYINGALDRLREYADRFKEDGLKEVNSIAYAHVLGFEAEIPPKNTYNGVAVKDGRLVLTFVPKYFGTNDYECAQEKKLLDALNDAPPPAGTSESAVSVKARAAIRKGWEPKVEALTAEYNTILGRSDIKLEPNFEEVFAALKKDKTENKNSNVNKDWEDILGNAVFQYFEGVKRTLDDKGFGKDEMLQEGFNEAVESGVVEFHVVDKLETGKSYNEVVFAGGKLKIQTTPTYFWVNVSDAAQKIVDLL